MNDLVSRFEFSDQDFRYISQLVSAHAGIHLNESKKELVYGRLAKRLRSLGLTRFRDYCELLEGGASREFAYCVNAITTNVTSFFRENHHFDFLSLTVFPELHEARARSSQRQLRIWSAGCSSGEEPYSIAITILESRPGFAGWDVEILATDLDFEVLDRARRGVYRGDYLDDFTVSHHRRWFQRGTGTNEGKIRVNAQVRDLVKFRTLNLIEPWNIEGTFDVIFCRNVMIYFDKPTRDILLQNFAARLNDNGYLFVGHSESLAGSSRLFESVGITVYRKRK